MKVSVCLKLMRRAIGTLQSDDHLFVFLLCGQSSSFEVYFKLFPLTFLIPLSHAWSCSLLGVSHRHRKFINGHLPVDSHSPKWSTPQSITLE